MKIYGYSNDISQEPMELNEVTLAANPELLRELSQFLLQCAKGIENNKEQWNHEHFSSKKLNLSNEPQIIVFNPHAK